MVVTKYLTVLSGKYPANLYRIPDSAGCLNFTGYRIPVSGSGTSLVFKLQRFYSQVQQRVIYNNTTLEIYLAKAMTLFTTWYYIWYL
jgi:hypothetical protein